MKHKSNKAKPVTQAQKNMSTAHRSGRHALDKSDHPATVAFDADHAIDHINSLRNTALDNGPARAEQFTTGGHTPPGTKSTHRNGDFSR